MGEYQLRCTKYGHPQEPYAMACPHDDSLLRTEYNERRFRVRPLRGIWKYLEWLPVARPLEEACGGPITYRSKGLARYLGLHELYISFNGFWPERGADLKTCSFKELEALPTLERLRERGKEDALVVASAGNTGRAFAHISSLIDWPCVVLVPRSSLGKLWLPGITPGRIVIVAVDGDYSDAIALADSISSASGFVPEGGARNVARRDGMGTTFLDAAYVMGRIPDHYYQAVGSGTGGISAYEASLRLLADGRFGEALPSLHLAQNLPCAPLLRAWKGGVDPNDCPDGIVDTVLFNRRPPYSVTGGVRDALDATNGEIVGVTSSQAREAQHIFEEFEEIDILPAPSVAVAALIEGLTTGRIGPEKGCLLNITGGGERRVSSEIGRRALAPDMTATPTMEREKLIADVQELILSKG